MPFHLPWNFMSSRNTHDHKPSLDSQPLTSSHGLSREQDRPTISASHLPRRALTSKQPSFVVTTRASSSKPANNPARYPSTSNNNRDTPAKSYANQFRSADYYDDPAFSSDPRDHPYFVANPDPPEEPSEPPAPPPLTSTTRGNTVLASVSSPLVPPNAPLNQEAPPTSTMLFGKSKKNVLAKTVEASTPGPPRSSQGVSRVRTMPSKPSLQPAGAGATHKAHRSHDVRPAIDAIDVLDSTNPVGLRLHHDGPYEAIKKQNLSSNPSGQPTARDGHNSAHKPHKRTGFEIGEIVPSDFAYQLARPAVHRQPEQAHRDFLPPGVSSPYRHTAPDLNPGPNRFPQPEPYNPYAHRPRESTPQVYRDSQPPDYEDAYGGMRSPRTQYQEHPVPAPPMEYAQQMQMQPSHPPAQVRSYQPPMPSQQHYQPLMPSQQSYQPPPMVNHHRENRPAQVNEPHVHRSQQSRSESNPRTYQHQQAPYYQSPPPQPNHRPKQLVMPAPLQPGAQAPNHHAPFNATAVSAAVSRAPQNTERHSPGYASMPPERNHVRRATINQNSEPISMPKPPQPVVAEQGKKKKLTKKRII